MAKIYEKCNYCHLLTSLIFEYRSATVLKVQKWRFSAVGFINDIEISLLQ